MSGEFHGYGTKTKCSKWFVANNVVWTVGEFPCRDLHNFTTLLHGTKICKNCQYVDKGGEREQEEPLNDNSDSN